jgi:hypothetical protein
MLVSLEVLSKLFNNCKLQYFFYIKLHHRLLQFSGYCDLIMSLIVKIPCVETILGDF